MHGSSDRPPGKQGILVGSITLRLFCIYIARKSFFFLGGGSVVGLFS